MKKTVLKLVSLILSLVLLSLPIASYAVDSVSLKELDALSILPEGITENNLDRAVTRDEFSYMTTHLIERENFVAVDTRFADVDKTNPYSGHIEFMAQLGIINGVSNAEFNPKGNLTSIMAYKIIVNVLGYDNFAKELGGYPDGYIQIANYLGISSIVAPSNEALTVKQALNLIYEALTNEYPNITYGEKDGELRVYSGEGTFSVLQRLKISSYTGLFRSVAEDNKSVTFEVMKNNYDTNYEYMSKGQIGRFDLKSGIDAYHYMNVPISVYVDENDKIISITENKRYDIFYTTITAVNGNEDKDAKYAKATIENISLTDIEDEFDVTEDFTLSVNNVITNSQAKITGAFAKVVLCDDLVYHIDAWQVEKGGIIKEISAEGITYTYGETDTKKLKNISDYKNVFVYINGQRTDLDQLKKNSVFDYYANGNTLMIACCEKVITDALYSINNTDVEIGSMLYRYEELFYQVDDGYKKYVKGSSDDIFSLFGEDVTVYFGPDNMVRYITNVSEIDSGEFHGIVIGVNPVNLSEEAEIKILSIFPQQETNIYKLTKKTAYAQGLSMNVLGENAYKGGYFDGNAVYMFKKNAKGEIVEVNFPEYIKGFGDGPIKREGLSSFSSGYTKIDNKPYFLSGVPIVAVYPLGDELATKVTDYSTLSERQVESATMVFYGSDIVAAPDFVLLCGKLGKIGDKAITLGIVTDRKQTLNDKGEQAWELNILVKGGGLDSYVVSNEEAAKIPENAYIAYYKNQLFSESPIYIDSSKTIDFTEHNEKWTALSNGTSQGLQKGKVSAISDTRICVESGGVEAVHCMHPSRCIFIEVDEAHPTARFKYIETADIEVGDTVFYYIGAEGVEAVIAIH